MKIGKFTWGLVILILGVIFLGLNLSWWNYNIWPLVFSFWPFILIIVGLGLMIRNPYIFLFVFVAGILFVVFSYRTNFMGTRDYFVSSSEENSRGEIIRGKESYESHYLRLNIGAVDLSINTNIENEGYLLSGKYNLSSGLELSKTDEGSKAKTTISQKQGSKVWTKNSFIDLSINKDIPLLLDINSGATNLDLDLQEVTLRQLNLYTGASSAKIALGGKDDTQEIFINCGASSFDISLPSDSGLKIIKKSGLTSINFQKLEVVRSGDTYTSNGYENASNKINIEIRSGASSFDFSAR